MAQVTISSPPLQEPGGSQRWLEWFNTIDSILSQLAGVQDGGFVNAANITYSGDNIFSGETTFTGLVDYSEQDLLFEANGATLSEFVVWDNINSSAGPPGTAPAGSGAMFIRTASSGTKNGVTISGPDGSDLYFASNTTNGLTVTNGAQIEYDNDSGGSLIISTTLTGGGNNIRLSSGGTNDLLETNETDGNVYVGATRGTLNDAPSANLVLPVITKGLRLNNVNNTNEGNFAGDGREGMLWYNTTIDKLKFYNGTPAAEIVFSEEAANLQTYTITNDNTDRSYDADSVTISEIADVLATLVADLQSIGIVL